MKCMADFGERDRAAESCNAALPPTRWEDLSHACIPWPHSAPACDSSAWARNSADRAGRLLLIPLRSGSAQQAATTSRPPGGPSVRSGDVVAVVSTVQALFAAAERNDLRALDSLYAGDSLTVVEGAGINRGWADYRDNHLGPELKEMKNFRYRPFEIQARVSGDLAWAMFRYALAADMEGRPIDMVGRGTAILERRGARWVVRHTQTASRPRRPADPAMPPLGR